MKKTSRHKLGKQLAVAIAVLIAVLFMTIPEVQAQVSKAPKSSEASSEKARLSSHNTPPPILIMDGSFMIEIKKPDFDQAVGSSGQPKKYKVYPVNAAKKVYIAHIKIVDGSGEILYRGDSHRAGNDLSVEVTTTGNDVVKLASVDNNLQIDTASTKKLHKATGADKPVGGLREGRFRHRTDQGSEDTLIRSLTVKKGATIVFQTDLMDLPGEGREMKVMIWHDERTP